MSDPYQNVLALARAGATSRAWEQFVASGLENRADDPKSLTLRGRLLKDRARKEQGEARSRLYARAAQAYADAAALRPDSYPLINAATMSLFAGQQDHMKLLAQEVLTLLQSGVGGGETPYWHEATRAEALLLLGEKDAARAALAEAISCAPQAWEDRAATLRQFRQISAFRGKEADWLSGFAPPASLHFAGVIRIAPDDVEAGAAIAGMVASIDPGFGYGALAAGADILIAEALVARDAELHVVLPVIPSVFKAVSVEPFGKEWCARFDALFENAVSVEIIDGGNSLSRAAIDIAADVAKGRAIDNAMRLEGNAAGMRVVFEDMREVGAEHILRLPPNSQTKAGEALPPLKKIWQIAVASANRPDGFERAHYIAHQQGHFIGYFDSLPDALTAMNTLRRAKPEAALAMNLAVAGDGGSTDDSRAARLIRMAQAAAAGTIVGGAEAAMTLKAHNPNAWIEPIGELSDMAGGIKIYAIDHIGQSLEEA